MNIDVLDQIRKARNDVMSSVEGNTGKVQLSVAQVDALLNTISEQESEILKVESAYSKVSEGARELLLALACNDFSKETPADDDCGDIFEVFVGTSAVDCGRIFANWDSSEGVFYQIVLDEDGVETIYDVENVLFWRPSLPEPHEMIEIQGLE